MQGCCSLEDVPTARISDAQAEVVLGGQRVSPRLSLCLSPPLLGLDAAQADRTFPLPEVELGSKLCRDELSLLSLTPLGWVVGRAEHSRSGSPKAILGRS